MNGVLEDEVMESLEALQRVLPKTKWDGTRNDPVGCGYTCTGNCQGACCTVCSGGCNPESCSLSCRGGCGSDGY